MDPFRVVKQSRQIGAEYSRDDGKTYSIIECVS
jgi:hypothetical protein